MADVQTAGADQHQPAWPAAGSDPTKPRHLRPPPLPEPNAPADPDRVALLARWLDLTRRVLPGMAAAQGWPISLDHCFMRVCLDAAFGRPWHEAVRRPAVRHEHRADVHLALTTLGCAIVCLRQVRRFCP